MPSAKLKPRKPSYRKRCNKCRQEIRMVMKEDYSWVPLDDPSPDRFGNWEVVEDVAYFHKQSRKGLHTDHRRTCT